MATLTTILVNADATAPRNWTTQGFAAIDEGIASADGTAIGDNSNSTTTLDTSFLLTDVDTDLGNVDTLSWQVRYRVIGAQTNTRGLSIRIVRDSDGAVLAANDAGGTFQTVASPITVTTFTNSAVVAFNYVNTAASKADWNGARVEIRLSITKSMAGDTNGVQVDTLQFTGTYTIAAAYVSPIKNRVIN